MVGLPARVAHSSSSGERAFVWRFMKPRFDLLPPEEIQDIVEVLTFGAQEHLDFGWRYVSKKEHFAAMLRHIFQWRSGKKLDSESGKSHLAHAVCRALFLMYLDKRG
jgi:hypothetical protein